MAIKSDRCEYVAAHVTRAIKSALRDEARRLNVTMSAYISDAVSEKLKASGVVIENRPINKGEPLPFDGAAAGE